MDVRAGVLFAAGLIAGSITHPIAAAEETPPPSEPASTHIDSTTIEASPDRAEVERRVWRFVNSIAVRPGEESLARWENQIPVCPAVKGMSGEDGEYILSRVSKIAADAGAPLAPQNCKSNFFIVVTSDPDGVIKAWSKRDVTMFGDETDQGGTKIHEFHQTTPVRVWPNTQIFNLDGTPLGTVQGRANAAARATRIEINNFRALCSIIVIVDARRMKGVSFGQVAAYVAMVGLVQIHPEADVIDAPSILNLFVQGAKAPAGLTAWDAAFLKGVYRSRNTDKAQIAAIKSSMVQDVAP
jgi:hypothetical protein